MGRKTRRAIERGIYVDEYGLSACVTVNGRQHEKRYPPKTPLRVIRAWRQDTEAKYRRRSPAKPSRGTLAADVKVYLKQVRHLVSAPELASVLGAWTERFGHKPRWSITPEDVRLTRNAWLEADVKPKTVNNRTAALRRLYRVLDGPRAWSPVDEVEPLAVGRTPPVFVTPETIRKTYDGLVTQEQRGLLRNPQTRARFMVLAASGVRPSELMRAKPGDVDLERRVWRTRDGKGGVRPGGMFLTDDLLAAFRLFVEADAWGAFNTGSFAKRLRSAGWPRGVRPYQLRHTVGQALSEAGVDLADVAAVLGHSRPDTTRRYYVPVLGGRMQEAMTQIGTRLGWATPPPVAPLDDARCDSGDTASAPPAASRNRRGARRAASIDDMPRTSRGGR
jgi:integrase